MVIVIVIAVIVFLVWLRLYRLRFDTVIAFTGGLGSGKTFLSVKYAVKLLRKQRFRVKVHNFFHRKDKREEPMLYSNIPIRISGKENAVKLEPEHLLLTRKIVPRSVVLIDEVGSFASQFDFNLPNVLDNFNEFVRLFRHYTLGGYLIVNDQCSENIVLQIRRRINTVFNLMNFRKHFGLVHSVRVRNISVSEEIKTIEEEDTEDNTTLLLGFMPLFKRYDTYCYIEKYNPVPKAAESRFVRLKRNRLLDVPKARVKKLTTNEEPPEQGGAEAPGTAEPSRTA